MPLETPRLSYLADHPACIPVLAEWFNRQWSRFLPAGAGVEYLVRSLKMRCNYDRIPLALVLLSGDTLLGSVSLKEHDMETRMELTPWLAGLYVDAAHRGHGGGTLLVKGCEEEARRLGVAVLYLFTPDAAEFYLRLGWTVYEVTEYKSARVTVMKKVL